MLWLHHRNPAVLGGKGFMMSGVAVAESMVHNDDLAL
jgi:hypothetical protein